MTNWEQISFIVVLVFFLLGMMAVLRGSGFNLIVLLLAGFSLGGFNFYYISTLWSPWKITLLIIFFHCFLSNNVIFWRMKTAWLLFFRILIISIILGLVIGLLVVPPLLDQAPDGAQSPLLRPVVQMYSYLSYLVLVPFAYTELRDTKNMRRFWSIYAYLSLFMVIVALVQIMFHAFGLNFMPILRMHGQHSFAAFQYQGVRIPRLYAFAGEPKALGAFLVPMLLASVVTWTTERVGRPWWAAPWVIMLVGSVSLLSFSSAVLIGLFLGFLASMIIFADTNRFVWTIFTAVVVVAFSGVLLGFVLGGDEGLSIIDLAWFRTVGRLEGEILDRPEYIALKYLFWENIAFLPFGLGLGMYNFHLPGLAYGAAVLPMDSGWMVVLLDLGLSGIGLILSLVLCGLRQMIRALQGTQARVYLVASGSAMLGAVFLHGGYNVMPLIFLFVGTSFAAGSSSEVRLSRVGRTVRGAKLPIRSGLALTLGARRMRGVGRNGLMAEIGMRKGEIIGRMR